MNDEKDMADSKLTIIVPAYNEASNISTLLDKVCAVVLPYNIGKEIIVVDDGSKDDTYQILQQYVAQHPEAPVKVFQHSENHGKGRAIRTALVKATGDYVIIQDGDLELDPNDIAKLLKSMIDGNHEVVYGSRFLNPNNKRLYHSFYFGGRLVSHVSNLLFNQRITDEPTCYKLMRTDMLKGFNLHCERFEFCSEVTAKVSKLGIKIHEEPINYEPRTLQQGKKLRWTDGIEAIWTLLKYRFID